MKTRILWVPPHERNLVPGGVYNLPDADAKGLIAAGEAEEVDDKKIKAEPDPRPQPEPVPADEPAAE